MGAYFEESTERSSHCEDCSSKREQSARMKFWKGEKLGKMVGERKGRSDKRGEGEEGKKEAVVSFGAGWETIP